MLTLLLQLTRESIQSSARASSPAIRAEEALQVVVQTVGQLTPEAAIDKLQEAIGAAYEANVDIRSPQMKVAAALMSTLENARAIADDAPAADPFAAQMDSLFANEYAMPDLDLDDSVE